MNTIRFSSQAWVIPLVCEHECDIHDPYDAFSMDCPRHNTIESTRVSLADFELTDNTILHLDDTVIQDREYSIWIDKPLGSGVSIKIKKTRGTTLRELIWSISRIYARIYEIEENTASENSIPIEQNCMECGNAPLAIREIEGDGESCSICYNPLEENVVQTICSHAFHSECIDRWVQVSNPPSCPMCRGALRHCNACDGTGTVTQIETFTEIPMELASYLTGGVRNTTDGRYQIHTYFMSQLTLCGLQYDRTTRTVSMTITS